MVSHLQKLANGMSEIVLWLDCDNEGENICFEILNICMPIMGIYSHKDKRVHRAFFSAIAATDILNALSNLIKPNFDLSESVEARQIIDLKVGVAFTRFMTM